MSLDACAEIVRRGDPDRFLTVVAAPLAARERLLPLYAFNVEISRAPWITREPMIAEMRLRWWRDTLGEIGDGGAPRAHEVAAPLAAVVRETGLDIAVLDRMIEARAWDVWKEPFAGWDALETYLKDTSGALMDAAARLLTGRVIPEASDFGFGTGVANWLVASPILKRKGCAPLVSWEAEAIRTLAENGLAALRGASAARRTVPEAAAPAFWAGWQAAALLRRAVIDPHRVAEGTLRIPEGRKKARLLWLSLTGRW
ncbi:MAG: squalene/phytoene synthase family protein [Pseudomonadota bacterium]